ncbi:MAG: hypothetical protein HON23_05040 [Rickettsiales bacterium]|jgi:hypothetical protein|nr:hypothetical protein [Rickettsiales bacterium]
MDDLINKYIQKFESSFHKAGKNECWVWKTSPKTKRTLRFFLHSGQKFVSAKRFSYMAYIGNISKGNLVYSKCGNDLCVNPYHLYIEKLANMNKIWHKSEARNRKLSASKQGVSVKMTNRNTAIGTRHGMAKLDPDKVRQIRDLVKDGANKKLVADLFGVSERNIKAIVQHDTWKHVK